MDRNTQGFAKELLKGTDKMKPVVIVLALLASTAAIAQDAAPVPALNSDPAFEAFRARQRAQGASAASRPVFLRPTVYETPPPQHQCDPSDPRCRGSQGQEAVTGGPPAIPQEHSKAD